MMCMGAILYEEFSKVVYAATLQDSNDNYCPEMITDIIITISDKYQFFSSFYI